MRQFNSFEKSEKSEKNMTRKLLLISNSIMHGREYLDHCADEIVEFLGSVKSILFIPYALFDFNEYETIAKKRFQKLDIVLNSIHHAQNPAKEVTDAQAIFIGGGNTFRLLNHLYKNDLIKSIKKRVGEGMLYIGASAGSNVACPTIKTTNDMPIVQPPSLHALDLIPFQINPHYVDPDPRSKHKGETRTQRIKEFHEENDSSVIGLREGSWLRVENKTIQLKGSTGAKIFQKGKKPVEYTSKNYLDLTNP